MGSHQATLAKKTSLAGRLITQPIGIVVFMILPIGIGAKPTLDRLLGIASRAWRLSPDARAAAPSQIEEEA